MKKIYVIFISESSVILTILIFLKIAVLLLYVKIFNLMTALFQRPALENFEPEFPRLSLDHASIKPTYDVVVVGSGYGGSIAASRCARAGQTVCVLERGKEWLPGDFPESFLAASKEIQIHPGGKNTKGMLTSHEYIYLCH